MGNSGMRNSLIVEFLGAFALVFLGVGSIIATQGQDIVAIALAHGLAIGLMVLAAGHISGGHYNPAVTVAMLVTRRIDANKAITYIIAQLLGGLAGAGALTLCVRDIERNGVNLGMPAVGTNMSTTNALVMEIIMTFFLVFVIFGTAVDGRTPKIVSGLAIGLTISIDIMAGGAISGAAMNPARWFGPAIVQGDFTNFWIWIVGPIIGAVIAAVLYNDVLMGGRESSSSAAPAAPVPSNGESAAAAAERSRRSQRRGR